jgi:tetratricopeptide (TPR) repeat protein
MRDGDLHKALLHIKLLAKLEKGTTAAHGLHQILAYCELKARPNASDYVEFTESSILVKSVYTSERLAAIADLLSFRGCPSVDFSKLRFWLIEISAQAEGDWMMAFQMARIFEALGNPMRAIELLDAANRLDSTRNEPDLIKMRIYVAKNELTKAREVLEALQRGDRRILRYQQDLIEGYRRWLEADR